MLTDAEAEKQREEGGVYGPSPVGLDGAVLERPGTATSTEPEIERESLEPSQPSAGTPDSKRHLRRSLQKTLRDPARRESHKDMHHHHSKKGSKNDSVSSAIVSEGSLVDGDILSASGEGLKRHKGSFTVHGKKASVVTFGGDWANMDPGERLKTLARHESQKDTERLSYQSPPAASMGPIVEGSGKGKALDGGFMIPPRRSSVSLKERRAISQSITSAGDSGSELGTARSLRKFSSSSGPPVFEDLSRVREAARRNGNGFEEESSEDEDNFKKRDADDTPRPNKQKPLDATTTTTTAAKAWDVLADIVIVMVVLWHDSFSGLGRLFVV
jgi:hypothetical protein